MTPNLTDKRHWSTTDVASMLISNNALASVTTRDAVVVAQKMRLSNVAGGTFLFKAGDTNTDFMALVLEGEAVVQSNDPGTGESMVLHVLATGNIVGEMAMVANMPRSASVLASTDLVVAVLDQSAFALMIKQAPDVACTFLSALLHSTSDRLRESNRKLLTLTKISQSLFEELDAGQQSNDKFAELYVPASNFKAVQAVSDRPSQSNSRYPSLSHPKRPSRFRGSRA